MYRKSVLGVLAAGLVVLAGCGDGATGPSTAAAPASSAAPAAPSAHNAADTAFAQGMIPHHSQAVAMADIAARQAADTRVAQLAVRIQQAQGPEIAQLRGFLAAWGEPETTSAGPTGPRGGMDHGAMGHDAMGQGDGSAGMAGTMSDQQMQQLQQAGGAEFDRLFLQMMVEHHEGAVEMARTELADGRNPDAQALAQKIIDDQRAEIAEMQTLF